MAYAIKYEGSYKSTFTNQDYTLEILEDGFSGTKETVDIEERSVEIQYSYDGENKDPLFCLRPSECTAFIAVTDSAYSFRDLLVADDEQFIVRLKKGSTIIFSGFFAPDEYQEQYAAPFIARIKAIDGIGTLKQKYLSSYSGRVSVASLIDEMFSKVSDIYSGEFLELMNSFPDHITSSDPVLGNIYVDRANYTEATNEDPEGRDYNCYEILDILSRSFNLSFQRGEGERVEVFEPNARGVNTETWKKYVNGSYDSDFVPSNLLSIQNEKTPGTFDGETEIILVNSDHVLQIERPLKRVDIGAEAQRTIKDSNLILNGGWKYWESGTPQNWTVTNNSTDGLVLRQAGSIPRENQNDYTFGFPLVIDAGTNKSATSDYMTSDTIRVLGTESYEFETGFYYPLPEIDTEGLSITRLPIFQMEIQLFGDSGTTYWLVKNDSSDGYSFTTNSSLIYARQAGSDMGKMVNTGEISIPEDGDLIVRFYGAADFGAYQSFLDDRPNPPQAGKKSVRPEFLYIAKTKLNLVSDIGLKRTRVREENNFVYSAETYEREVMHFDGVDGVGTTAEVTDSNGNVTNNWKRDSGETGLSLLRNLARVILDTYNNPHYRLTGTLHHADKAVGMFNTFTLSEGNVVRRLIPVAGTYDTKDSAINSVELVEVEQFTIFIPTTVDEEEEWEPSLDFPGTSGTATPAIGPISNTEVMSEDYDWPAIRVEESTTDKAVQRTISEPSNPPNSQSRAYLSDGTDGFSEGDEVIKFTDSAGNTTTNKRFNSGDTLPKGNLPSTIAYTDESNTFSSNQSITGSGSGTQLVLTDERDGGGDVAVGVTRRSGDASDTLSALKIYTTNNADGFREVARFNFTGNFGVDNVNPAYKIDANGDVNGTALRYGGQNTDNRYPLRTEKGSSNGFAGLDANGKVPTGQLPNSIMEYKGTWNADTNTPSLSDGTGNAGSVYRVSVAGTHDFGSGAIEFDVGDYVIYNASDEWEKSDTTDSVPTVFGRSGNVTAQSGDYDTSQVPENGNLYFTNSRADARIQNAINDSGTASDELWSSSKISSELAGKSEFTRTVVNTDSYTIDVASSGAVFVIDSAPDGEFYTITLDDQIGIFGGIFTIKDETGGAGTAFYVNIGTSDDGNIDGASTLSLSAYESVTFYFQNGNFFILSRS